MAELTHIYWTS